MYMIKGTHRSELVCNISTTFRMTASDSVGTCSQTLKASINWDRMSFPGLERRYVKGSRRRFSSEGVWASGRERMLA